ncbi:S-adenosyl-L-methionine-dependent methyltransferase [Polyplosphaeria fusca]|uniref:S-adenosyl-L-methionine-dependent methyltransferase n=1 Tax=Polyplosphaeria fusca TaxID=682080 RepID=A0A9P4RCP0_9PLEO|nr:S-adenosyl-L-methionine-dependent methyltransferase [Polyplosphaeria fusca]
MANDKVMPDNEYDIGERSYHSVKGAQYTLPNDAAEHHRLETQAVHLSALMDDNIIHSPITRPVRKVLDVGCGTGIVTDVLAKQYPTAKVFGLDLTPVPTIKGRQVSPNITFVQGDILNLDESSKDGGGLLPNGTAAVKEGGFDLIYSRLLLAGMYNWPEYLRTAQSLLSPGTGWVEIHDLDWHWYDADNKIISNDWKWFTTLRQAAEERGLDYECGSRTAGWMKDAGLVDITVKVYRWPWGGQWEEKEHMRAFGNYYVPAMKKMLWYNIPKVTEHKGYSEEQIGTWRKQMIEDFEPAKGKHWKFYVTCGRRPE